MREGRIPVARREDFIDELDVLHFHVVLDGSIVSLRGSQHVMGKSVIGIGDTVADAHVGGLVVPVFAGPRAIFDDSGISFICNECKGAHKEFLSDVGH